MTEAETQAFAALLARAPRGPRIELGVASGRTLRLIAEHAGETFGVDSFEGMPEPDPARDVKDGWNPYPRGRLAVPMEVAAARVPGARLIRGFVPAVLADVPERAFAFAHLDMDQFGSTLAALRWIWPRMRTGGIVCCDDWFADRDWLAAGAINAFAQTCPITGSAGRKVWWIKGETAR